MLTVLAESVLGFGTKIWEEQNDRQTDRQTDTQTRLYIELLRN